VTISQREGKIHATWEEDSLCSDRFSVERVVLDMDNRWKQFSGNPLVEPESAPFKYSNWIEQAVVAGTLKAKSVVTDFFATSSSCKDKFSLVVDDIQDVLEDLKDLESLSAFDTEIPFNSKTVVGKFVVYCIVSANPAVEECKLFCLFVGVFQTNPATQTALPIRARP
jgi:hypothetical protein